MEPDKTEIVSSNRKAEVIGRLRSIKDSKRFSDASRALNFIGRLCTQNDLAVVVDPKTFKVPLTDTLSLTVRKDKVQEPVQAWKNPYPKSKDVTIPEFNFEDRVNGVRIYAAGSARSTHGNPNSFFNQKGGIGSGRVIDDLYDGNDGINYEKAVWEALFQGYTGYNSDNAPDSYNAWKGEKLGTFPSDNAAKLKLEQRKKLADTELNRVLGLSPQEVAERFIKAIDPKASK